MSATGKWFVMMFSQNGNYVMPLTTGDDNDEVMLWDTEEDANAAGIANPFANSLGFHSHEVGA
jgi:hypothetical protein